MSIRIVRGPCRGGSSQLLNIAGIHIGVATSRDPAAPLFSNYPGVRYLGLYKPNTAMRRFTLGSGADRKVVVVELDGSRMTVVQFMTDGDMKRSQTGVGSGEEGGPRAIRWRASSVALGFVERVARGSRPAREEVRPAREKVRPARQDSWAGEGKAGRRGGASRRAARGERMAPELRKGPSPFDDIELPEPRCPHFAAAGGCTGHARREPTPKKKKKKAGGKKKRKEANGGDGLDKRVIAGFGAVVALFLFGAAFLAYEAFLKPPTIVGSWSGAMLEHEISKSLTNTHYQLVLDAAPATRP